MATLFKSSTVAIYMACFLVCGINLQIALSQEPKKSKKQIEAEEYEETREKATAVFKAKPVVIDAKDDVIQKLLKERFNKATQELETQFVLLDANFATVDAVGASIHRWTNAGLEVAVEPAAQLKILEMQVVVSKFLELICATKFKGDSEDLANVLQAKNLRITAEVELLRMKKSIQVSKGN